jgi:hypothetical protein
MSTTTPEAIKMQIAELQEMILKAHPRMPMLLRDIHKILREDAENVTLLSESDIGVIVSGLKAQTKTVITAAALTSKKTSLKNTQLADL